MEIFTQDLLRHNFFPLNKLILRQIVELKKIEILETTTQKIIQDINVQPVFKYLNYKGGIPTQTRASLPFINLLETLAVDDYLEKF